MFSFRSKVIIKVDVIDRQQLVMAQRLAHIGMGTLKKLMKKELIRGLKDVTFEKDKLCSACQASKQVAHTHPTKAYLSNSRVLELLHMDLFGPTTYASLGGNKYCLVIEDDCNTSGVCH